ncbi:MAG: PAS domain S-box protein [Oligoflexia bacterium]|nr:PAS domain S-box protein [Oligoflexia bacterium]
MNGDQLEVNSRFLQLTGYASEELRTLDDWFGRLFGHRAGEWRSIYDESKLRSNTVERILPFRIKNGSIRHFHVVRYVEPGAEIWLLHDMTERILDEERFRLLFRTASDPIFLLAGDRVIDCNPAALSILGFEEKEQILGHHPAEFTPEFQPDGRRTAEYIEELDRLLTERDHYRFEVTHRKKDGTEFPVEVTINAIQVNGVRTQLAFWHDLTEQKQLSLQLAQASKMASLGEMAGALAHEINSPLAVIRAKAQQVRIFSEMDQQIPELVLRNLESIEKTVDRIAAIIGGLRSFARDSSKDPPEDSEAEALLADALNLCGQRFKHAGISVTFESQSPGARIFCRRSQITQVLLNLLNNAFDAVKEQAEKWVRLEIREAGSGIEFRVTDSGPGIPGPLRPKLMLPFFTTKDSGKGSGLGLSASKGILEQHSGKLFLDESCPNTCFIAWLPRRTHGETADE